MCAAICHATFLSAQEQITSCCQQSLVWFDKTNKRSTVFCQLIGSAEDALRSQLRKPHSTNPPRRSLYRLDRSFQRM